MKALLFVLCMHSLPMWQRVSEENGLVVEVQQVAGSACENVRVRGTSTASTDTFANVW